MTIQTRDAELRLRYLAIVGGIELLLRERRQQQAQALHLNRREDPVHQLEKVACRQQLAFRHVTELGPRRQKDGRRKFRQQVIRQMKVDVETLQRAMLTLVDLIDLELREDHAAGLVLG